MESYNKQLRDKRELEKKLSMYAKEQKSTINLLNMERSQIQGGLLDVQSKTKNLTDTVNSISGRLKEERKVTQAALKELQVVKNHPQTFRRGNREAIQAELDQREQGLVEKIELITTKLELLTGQKQLPEVNKALNINLISKKKGFGAVLSKIRTNKEIEAKQLLPSLKSAKRKPDFSRPNNVCELIEEFHKLPKLYPIKPKMKKPEMTQVLLNKYEDRKKHREAAMNYGTRTRIKRAQFHCDSLAGVYLPKRHSMSELSTPVTGSSSDNLLLKQMSKTSSHFQLQSTNSVKTMRAITH